MANQPKRYKKFVATAATATLVASAIAPVASASFKDVADNNDHKKNIEAIAELGYMGAGDNFRPSENVTRGQVAIILANWAQDVAGLEVPADYKDVQRFKDVPLTADDKLLQSAALVKEYGIFEGSNGNLNGASPISREHMALVLNKAYEAVTGTSLVELAGDTSDVTFADEASINKDYLHVVKALKKLGITAPASFNPKGSVTRGQFASFFVQTVNAEEPVDETELKVESVSAINATEIKVVFNTELNKDSAQTAANYEILVGNDAATPATDYRAVLQDDKKTVILQFGTGSPFTPAAGIAKGQTYQVNVKDKKVLSSTYEPIPEFKDSAKIFSDNTAPKLVSSVLNGSTLELTFDEAISSIGSVKVDGKSVPAAILDTDAGKYKAYISISDTDLLTLGSHNVAIYSTADYSGNSELLINSTYTATENNVKPAVEKVEAKSTKVFRVKFSAPISGLTNANFEIKKGNYTFQAGEVSVTPVGTTGKEYDVTVTTAAGSVNPLYATGENSVNLAVKVKDFKGSNNVFGEAYNTTVTLVKDTVAPTVLNSAVNSAAGSVLTVIFNEELDSTFNSDGVLDSKLSISKDGVRLTGFTAVVDSTDKKKVNITLASPVTDGTYNVTFGAGAVRDIAENENAAQTTSVNAVVLSNTVFQPNAVTITQDDTNNVLRVAYYAAAGTKMTDSALNLANYKLDGIPLNSPLFAGADIAFTNADKHIVEIKLPKGQFPSSGATTSVEISNNVKDENGTSIAKSSTEKNIAYTTTVNTVEDDVAPELKSAEYIKNNSTDTATNTLRFTFSEAVTASDVEDFLVTVGGTVVDVTNVVQNNNKEIVVRLATSVNVAQAGTVAITTDKKYNTNGTIEIVDGSALVNKAAAKSVTLSTSSTDSTAYVLANPATPGAPSVTLAAGSAAGTTAHGLVTDGTYEYSYDGGAWTALTTADLAVDAGKTLSFRTAANGLTPAGTATTKTVALTEIKPVTLAGITSAAGSTAGTKLAGLTAGTVYEYVINSSATPLADNDVAWDTADTYTAVATTDDDVVLNGTGTHIHIRVKATSTQPASTIVTTTYTTF